MIPAADLRAPAALGFTGPGTLVDRLAPWWRPLRRKLGNPHVLLIVVCVAHAALAIGFVVAHHMWWEEDETVYLSQVAAHSPALLFTPPRARGIPVLLFPALHFTSSLGIVRTYVVVLGSIGMYLGFRPWLRLGFSRVVPGAALLFSSLWVTTFFGAETQPNYLDAVVCLAAAGYFVLAMRAARGRRNLVALGFWLALLALIRPSDATWLAAALGLATIGIRGVSGRRRLVVGATLLVGLSLGWSEWVIEAYTSYGGFFQRLHAANAENTPGVHFSLLTQASAVNGPTLCRPCLGRPVSAAHIAWWLAIPPLLLLGFLRVRRTRRFGPLAVAAAGGTALLLEYVLTISYAAPRFLLPSYALLSIPAAAGVATLVRWRPQSIVNVGVVAALAALLVAQIVTQNSVLRREVSGATQGRARYLVAAQRLQADGVHAPCVIYGYFGPPTAFALGCNDRPLPPQLLSEVATGTTVVVLTNYSDGKRAYPGWQQVPLAQNGLYGQWLAHVLPGGSAVT